MLLHCNELTRHFRYINFPAANFFSSFGVKQMSFCDQFKLDFNRAPFYDSKTFPSHGFNCFVFAFDSYKSPCFFQ